MELVLESDDYEQELEHFLEAFGEWLLCAYDSLDERMAFDALLDEYDILMEMKKKRHCSE